jgi:N-acyl-D-aspartate/D-glutamate deacylase
LPITQPEQLAQAALLLGAADRPHLRRVINATGVVLHTNLGRSLLAEAAVERVLEVARHYSNLEYRLEEGERGSRHEHVEALLCRLTGAEAAMVVNNGAAALGLNSGCLEAGRDADLIIVDTSHLRYMPHYNVVSNIVYSGCDRDVLLTMVGGDILYENGKVTFADEAEVLAHVREFAEIIKSS